MLLRCAEPYCHHELLRKSESSRVLSNIVESILNQFTSGIKEICMKVVDRTKPVYYYIIYIRKQNYYSGTYLPGPDPD